VTEYWWQAPCRALDERARQAALATLAEAAVAGQGA